MTTIIIPDIHLRHPLVDKILTHTGGDRVLFLGDHFDQFNDSPGSNYKSALWVKNRQITHPNDIWLWGNHDLHYAKTCRCLKCSGYTEQKDAAINSVMGPDQWNKFVFHYWLGPWLCTHAGLSPRFIPATLKTNEEVKKWLLEEEVNASKAMQECARYWMYNAGMARGGNQVVGGITWCDFNSEFTTVPGINQIFGHTDMGHTMPGMIQPRYGHLTGENSDNYNLDVSGMYYAIWDETELKIKSVIDELTNIHT